MWHHSIAAAYRSYVAILLDAIGEVADSTDEKMSEGCSN